MNRQQRVPTIGQLLQFVARSYNRFKFIQWIIAIGVAIWFVVVVVRFLSGERLNWFDVLGLSFGFIQAVGVVVGFIELIFPNSPISIWIRRKIEFLSNKAFLLGETMRSEKPIWGRPLYLGKDYCIGRDEFLESIHTILQSRIPHGYRQPLAITGEPGTGKTEAIFAYTVKYRDAYTRVLWLNASSLKELRSSCKTILVEMNPQSQEGTTARRNENADIPALWPPSNFNREGTAAEPNENADIDAIKRWLQRPERNKGWLLILDRCGTKFGNDPIHNNTEQIELKAILEGFLNLTQYGSVVLTTNERTLPIKNLPIPPWEINDGRSFLFKRIGVTKPEPELIEQARKISEKLDNLPLALEFAAASIIENGGDFSEFLDRYKTKQRELFTRYIPQGFPETLSASLLVFLHGVEPSIVRLLKLCTVLDLAPIPRVIIAEAQTAYAGPVADENIDKLINTLGNLPFLEKVSGTLRVGHLLQMLIRAEMEDTDQLQYITSAVRILSLALEKAQFEDWKQIQLYLPHAYVCAEYIKKFDIKSIEAIQLLNITGHYLQELAQYKEAEQILRQALELGQKMEKKGTLARTSIERATCLNYLGELYHAQGQYSRAYDFYKQAQEGYKANSNGTVLNNLGMLSDDWSILDNKSPQQQAKGYYREAFDIHLLQQINLQKHSAVCDLMFSLSNLAWSYYEHCEHEQAEGLLQEASYIFQQILGTDYADRIQSSQALPSLDQSQLHWHIYAQIFRGILEVFKRLFKTGDEAHPYIAQCYAHLGAIYARHGESKKAQNHYKEAIRIGQRYCGKNHPYVAGWLNNLAEQYHCRGQYDKAKNLYQQSMDIYLYRQTPGESHLMLAYVKSNYEKLPSSIEKGSNAGKYAAVDPAEIRKHARTTAEMKGGILTSP